MSAIVRCDNCGGTWDTGGSGHVCQPEDLCERIDADLEGVAGDLLRINVRLRRIEKFCENHDSFMWAKLGGGDK